ncbi:hypothetical protein [Glycomyces sp. NRRL B-16210]|uniref:hypothetical protein n=1 Tax=Glycomyces sp. NRRL B-16210 TaxID=1463821 RepID=UPI0004BE4F08|nr:hypothetical protein [Glycomyces sp. NRRL B-16210]
MAGESGVQAILRERYPLPQWVVDSPFKQELTLTVAEAIGAATGRWPEFEGPGAQLDYAGHVTRAVLDAIGPLLAWLDESPTDGYSYPGDPLVSYISQLALTRPREAADTGRYRELLRLYGRYLTQQALRFEPPAG